MKYSYKGHIPKIASDVYIGPGASVIGRVTMGAGSSIWPNAVVRGDIAEICIGERTNIQDNSTLHVDSGHPLKVGNDVVVGHNAILHGCTVEDNCLIGMGAIVLDGAIIGERSLIGAGALIAPNKVIPPQSLVMGSPGKVVRNLTEEEVEHIRHAAAEYSAKAQEFMTQVLPIDEE